MVQCGRCGRESAGRFCPGCGQPVAAPAGAGVAGVASAPGAAGTQQLPTYGGGAGPAYAPPGGPGVQPPAGTSAPTVRDDARRGGGGSKRAPGGPFRGRPLQYRTSLQWITSGLVRNPRASIVALITAWFNVVPALMLGAVGAVVGAIAGYAGGIGGAAALAGQVPFYGEFLARFGYNVGGVGGVVIGFLVGAIGGFLAGLIGPWLLVYQHGVPQLIGNIVAQVLSAIVIAFAYTVVYHAAEGWTLVRIAGARRPSRRERELLLPLLELCAERMGLRGRPYLMIDDSRDNNAYAVGRHIVVNQGLLDEFDYDRDVTGAVIAHELTHWTRADVLAGTFSRGLALPLYVPYAIFRFLSRIMTRPIFVLILGWLAWPYYFCMRFFIAPAHAADSQAAEYRADQGAVLAGGRPGLRRFLARLRDTTDGALNGWDAAICRTHPPSELRLEAIEETGKRYPLPDPDGPVRMALADGTSSLTRD